MTFTTADRQDYTQHLVQLLRFTQLEAHSVRLLTCHPQPIVDGVRFHVMCRDSTGSHLFFKPLRYRLGCHLIATLVKRLWLSYTTGLHIPATRWIGILPKESPDRCGTCAIYRTANYHTGAGNCQYPWCDLNVPLVTLMVKRRMYFLLP